MVLNKKYSIRCLSESFSVFEFIDLTRDLLEMPRDVKMMCSK